MTSKHIKKNKHDLIQTPVVTEKSTVLGEFGKYVFKVSPRANKTSIKKSIETIFSVNITSVNILNQKGKVKKFKGVLGSRAKSKKAIITLEKDQSIDLSGGIK